MTLSVTIDENGISAPTYEEILEGLREQYQAIYGSDVLLGADTQDGQFLAVFALAIHDCNQAAIKVYTGYAPSFAQGLALSNQVKINGLRRRVATHSTAVVTLTGVVGTEIVDGKVSDQDGNLWSLPASVTIGVSGEEAATATADDEGAITAGAGQIDTIATPTQGWQAVTNEEPATAGDPVETDAVLRRRQTQSVAEPASTIVESLQAAIGDLAGVQRNKVYENDTDSTDANTLPAHSISVVVAGGDSEEIAEAIALRKPPGIQTYGSTTETVVDSRGETADINFYPLATVSITVDITIDARPGYVAATGDAIKQAIVDYLSALPIGEDSYISRLYTAANLGGAAVSSTYVVTVLEQARDADPTTPTDVEIAFNEAAVGALVDVNLTVT